MINHEQINSICSQLLSLGNDISSNLKGELHDDLKFMCGVFAKRQVSQMESLLLLGNQDDVILISRSMFEGALYLRYSAKHHKERKMAKRWRLFAAIVDLERIDNGEVPSSVVRDLIDRLRPDIEKFFPKNKKGERPKTWNGRESIRKIAEETSPEFLRWYVQYYSKMSDYHHWGTESFGKRYQITDDNIGIENCNSDEIKNERTVAMLMAASCLLASLMMVCTLFRINRTKEFEELTASLAKIEGVQVKYETISYEIM